MVYLLLVILFSGLEDMHCLTCLDVTVMDDVEVSSSLYDNMVQVLDGGSAPSTCIKPETKRCQPGEEMICVNSHSVLDINGKLGIILL